MSIEEKVSTMVNNTRIAYDIGDRTGVTEVGDSIWETRLFEKNGTYDVFNCKTAIVAVSNIVPDPNMDAFWDVFQNYGHRTDYSYAFRSGSTGAGGWNDETFNPKYTPIQPVGSTPYMFEYTQITEIGEDKVDFSKASSLNQLFYFSKGIKSVVMDVSSARSIDQAFRDATNLTSVTIKYLRETCSLSSTFFGCTGLTDLTFYQSTIGKTLSLSSCTKLTGETIFSQIIENLANKAASGTTETLTLGATNLAKLTDAEKAVATQKGWTLA